MPWTEFWYFLWKLISSLQIFSFLIWGTNILSFTICHSRNIFGFLNVILYGYHCFALPGKCKLIVEQIATVLIKIKKRKWNVKCECTQRGHKLLFVISFYTMPLNQVLFSTEVSTQSMFYCCVEYIINSITIFQIERNAEVCPLVFNILWKPLCACVE